MTEDTAADAPSTWWDRLYDPATPGTHASEPARPAPAPVQPGQEQPAEPDEDPEPEEGAGRWWSKLQRKAAEDDRVEPDPAVPDPAAPAAAVGPAVPGQPAAVPVPQQAARMDPVRRARWRRALYSGTAAAAGAGVGLVRLEQGWMHVGAQAPAGTAALILALAGGSTAWRLFGLVTGMPYKAAAQTMLVGVTASFGYQYGPAAVHALAAIGLAPAQTMPLITGAGIYALTWHLIDRRTRTWWAPLAWTLRIPLASAALALALYSTR